MNASVLASPSFCYGGQNMLNKRPIHLTSVKKATPEAVSSHRGHWVAERVMSAGLYAVIPAAFILEPSFAMDTALCTSLVIHSHWGISGVFADYMHGYPSDTGERRYPILTTMAKVLPYVLSITAFACLMNFNYNDVGLVKAICMLWKLWHVYATSKNCV